jgi:ABC-type polysaccharide/polyol phosphate transport system ATPase subunit
MSDVVIRAERLGKKYVIGHEAEREPYVTLRDVLVRGAKNAWRKTADMARGRAIIAGDTMEEFWALKDVSFELKRGEVLGIIGRNGAGKSTLLKILSRITEPTEGRVMIKGRVASLLEVGTGFHPELTGRENIFLNGAILGMRRAEMKRKFDEIVAFAEVEKFLDTPVKRYSSGMYLRLAFAVAAHLEPEILVVDEVLAVGDSEFQQKCLGKMQDIAQGAGRTILFVSHALPAILNLCTTAIYLREGAIVQRGEPVPVCTAYNTFRAGRYQKLPGSALQDISLLDDADMPRTSLIQGRELKFRLVLTPPENKCEVSLLLRDMRDAILVELFDPAFFVANRNTGDVVVQVDAGFLPLLPGDYWVDFRCGDLLGRRIELSRNVFQFQVLHAGSTDFTGTDGNIPVGSFYYRSRWHLVKATVLRSDMTSNPELCHGVHLRPSLPPGS